MRAVAGRMAARLPGIDVVVNNAGGLFPARRMVAGGFEATVALNLLSPFLLTEVLLPSLAAAGGRVITMTSAGLCTQRFELSSLVMGGEGYDGAVAYARAKRAQVVLTEEWQLREPRCRLPHGPPGLGGHPGAVARPARVRSGQREIVLGHDVLSSSEFSSLGFSFGLLAGGSHLGSPLPPIWSSASDMFSHFGRKTWGSGWRIIFPVDLRLLLPGRVPFGVVAVSGCHSIVPVGRFAVRLHGQEIPDW